MKIGIITNAYELPRIKSLLDYLEPRAEVRVYLEDDAVYRVPNFQFDEDVFFTKGKGYILLILSRLAEECAKGCGAPVVNTARSVWLATHRFMHCLACEEAGVRVPEYALSRAESVSWSKFIAKNVIDQNHLRNLDLLPVVGGPGTPVPDQPTGEEAGRDPRVWKYHLFQRYLDSEYEYKVYGFGDELLFYRQVPVLKNPDKMSTRVPIDPVPELERMARLVMGATGLRVTSIDFLEQGGEFYVTDVNPIPNFNYVDGGARILGDYLLEQGR
ncbi:MAG: hypothetical protein ACTSU5_07495 [Promethearchaeota archaeon]